MSKKYNSLTNTQVKNARSELKEYNLGDGEGLSLRIKPDGSKYWIFNYTRPYTKKRANKSFGTYPEISLAKARELKREAREHVAQNIDPNLQKKKVALKMQAELNNTFEKIAFEYFETQTSKLDPKTSHDKWRRIEMNFFPKLGKMPIGEIEAPMAIEALKPLEAANKRHLLKKTVQVVNQVMNYAMNTGAIKANPLAQMQKAFKSPETNHLPAMKPESLKKVIQAISQHCKFETRCALELTLHTMVRVGSLVSAKWADIDFDNAVWTIPEDNMKKVEDHTFFKVPLTEQALSLLEAMKPLTGHQTYIFPNRNDHQKHMSENTLGQNLRRLGFQGEQTVHGFRSVATTALNDAGFNQVVIDACLAHKEKDKTRAAYNRAEYVEQRRKIMAWWSNFIDELSTGKLTIADSNITPFRKQG